MQTLQLGADQNEMEAPNPLIPFQLKDVYSTTSKWYI